jgi:hypothetical protein
MVNRQRFRNVGGRPQFAGRRHRGERSRDEVCDFAEAYSPIQKRRYGDFVGAVERSGRASPGAQRLDCEPKRRKALEVGALEGQSAKRREVGRADP